MYRLTETDTIIRIADGAFIPADVANADYRAYLAWVDAGNEPEAYVPPPAPIPATITRRQCAKQLRNMGLIDADEMVAMVRTGEPPSMVATLIAAMPAGQRPDAEADFAADTYARDNPLLVSMMEGTGATAQEIDGFFVAAAQL